MSLSDVISSLLGRRRPVREPVHVTGAHYWLTNPYHAVEIAPGLCACEAVRPLAKQRYLARRSAIAARARLYGARVHLPLQAL